LGADRRERDQEREQGALDLTHDNDQGSWLVELFPIWAGIKPKWRAIAPPGGG
jgi:hypothetical protein